MIRTIAGLFIYTSVAAFAQQTQPGVQPDFEVASVRPGQPGRESIEHELGSLRMRNARLTACIRWAYDVLEYQVSGPAWMNDAWFDISAKAASPANEAELRRMLQTLLAKRFQLTLHREIKDVPALILTVGKNGHKLQPVEAEGSPSFTTGKLNLTGRVAQPGCNLRSFFRGRSAIRLWIRPD